MSEEGGAGEVFGTSTDSSDTPAVNMSPGHVMSDRVKSLASSIYEEFEHMIQKYDNEVVKDLMPLVVTVLETLDTSYSDKQENEVEVELLREDNQQLLSQYDREKQLRKIADQKLLIVEDAVEEDRKKTEEKVENLESMVRTLEMKAKNASDHVTRLEEKEAEMKKEYNKLHERYTDMFKTHMEYLERSKSSRLERSDSLSSSRGKGFVMPNLRPVHVHHHTNVHISENTPSRSPGSVGAQLIEHEPHDLGSELAKSRGGGDDTVDSGIDIAQNQNDNNQKERSNSEVFDLSTSPSEHHATAEDVRKTMADIVETTPELEDFDDASYGSTISANGKTPNITNRNAQLTEQDSIFDELNDESSEFIGELDDGADITGMGKEVENLIEENAELLATKNALNIVKDDLIAQVDELSSEVEMVRGEVRSLRALTDRYKERIYELEEQLKKQKEDFDQKMKGGGGENEEDLPRAQRKRFTRVEMARVLMERNQYKERLMELQEAVRWTEMIRASREHPELAPSSEKRKDSKSGIWNFFGNLFGDGNSEENKPPPAPKSVKYMKGPGLPKHI